MVDPPVEQQQPENGYELHGQREQESPEKERQRRGTQGQRSRKIVQEGLRAGRREQVFSDAVKEDTRQQAVLDQHDDALGGSADVPVNDVVYVETVTGEKPARGAAVERADAVIQGYGTPEQQQQEYSQAELLSPGIGLLRQGKYRLLVGGVAPDGFGQRGMLLQTVQQPARREKEGGIRRAGRLVQHAFQRTEIGFHLRRGTVEPGAGPFRYLRGRVTGIAGLNAHGVHGKIQQLPVFHGGDVPEIVERSPEELTDLSGIGGEGLLEARIVGGPVGKQANGTDRFPSKVVIEVIFNLCDRDTVGPGEGQVGGKFDGDDGPDRDAAHPKGIPEPLLHRTVHFQVADLHALEGRQLFQGLGRVVRHVPAYPDRALRLARMGGEKQHQ